jgi:hypothetical protein
MKKYKFTTLESLTNSFNILFCNKNLIIVIGSSGIMLSCFNRCELIDSVFIKNDNLHNFKKCNLFFKKHKNYSVTFLLDSKECSLSHETMPILHSILKINPVEQYINCHYLKSNIIAYNVYNISRKNGETWETAIAQMPYASPLKPLLNLVIKNSLKFNGIYFLTLEFQTIINSMITRSGNDDSKNDLQIFAAITKASDIRIAVCHKNNIMADDITPYPEEKSDLYICGTIEQIINDKILMFKDYVKNLNLKISILIVCDKSLQKIFNSMNINGHKIIALSAADISHVKNPTDNRFQDNLLIELFFRKKSFPASNSQIKSISYLTLVNSIIFKPLVLLMIGLILHTINLKYKISEIQKQTIGLNNKYYLLSEKYRNIKKKYPYITNVNNLADFYNYSSLLKTNYPGPFEAIKDLITVTHPQIMFKKIKWNLITNSSSITPLQELNIDLEFNGKANITDAVGILTSYSNQIRTIFQDYNTSYMVKQNKAIELHKNLIIPAFIKISNKIQE